MDNLTEKTKKVMIVEDEIFLMKALKTRLGKLGFEIFPVSKGSEAIDVFKKAKPDIVLLDLVLPEKDGFEVLKEIKGMEDEKMRNTPVIILSNLSQDSDMQKVKELGASEYLVKSDTPLKVIAEKIEKILSNKG